MDIMRTLLFADGPCMFQSGDAEVDAEEAIFMELIQTLLKDPAEREHFYQARHLHMEQSRKIFLFVC